MSKNQGKQLKKSDLKAVKLEKAKTEAEHKQNNSAAQPQLLTAKSADAFAYGISKAISEVSEKKGSNIGFLGVETQTLNPTDYTTTDAKMTIKKGQ